MKITSTILAMVISALLVTGCSKEDDTIPSQALSESVDLYEHNTAKITVAEGVAGTLTLKEGNCMPMIGAGSSTCKQYPVKRLIKIYPYTTIKEVTNRDGAFFTIEAMPLAIVKSDAEGFYQVSLIPGTYSVLVEEKGSLYANSSDGQGGLNPVQVERGKVSTVNPVINYASH